MLEEGGAYVIWLKEWEQTVIRAKLLTRIGNFYW